MSINEALRLTQGKGAGIMNQASVRYAQTLLLPEEEVCAAVIANITTKGEHYPGVVVLTGQRIMAACGLPGIKRSVALDLEKLDKCEENPSVLNYKATFYAEKNAFSFTVDPEVGEKFSRHIAVLNGDVDDFDTASENIDSGIFNPTLVRNKRRARLAREKERSKRTAAREAAQATQLSPAAEATDGESVQETAQRLARQLEDAKAKGVVNDTDPRYIAARLAAELAAEEQQHSN